MEIKGTLHRIFDEVQVTDKFKKREFVIETDEKYPQHVILQLTQDKTDLLEPYELGETINVSINIRGRMWKKDEKSEERFFNTIEAWKLEKMSGNTEATDEPDDLPF